MNAEREECLSEKERERCNKLYELNKIQCSKNNPIAHRHCL